MRIRTSSSITLEEMKRKIGNEISGIYSNIESKEEAKKMFMALESEDGRRRIRRLC